MSQTMPLGDELEATLLQELLRWDGVTELPSVSPQIAKALRTRVLRLFGRRDSEPDQFENPILTVDVVLFSLIDQQLHVLLTTRSSDPAEFEGMPALIGGYIHTQEDKDTHAAAKRVVAQKVGIGRWGTMSHLEQLAVFSGAKRDPRGWSATVAYIGTVKLANLTKKLQSEFFPVDALPEKMAFDHREIVRWAVDRIRNKATYSSLPLFLLPSTFTLGELHDVYQYLMGQEVDVATFRRRISELGFVEPTGEMSDPRVTRARPARLFRAINRNPDVFAETIWNR